MLGILSSLATFSLKKPKTVLIIAAIVAILAFSVHYKLLVGERDKLRIAEAGYKVAVSNFIAREASLQEDLRPASATSSRVKITIANLSAYGVIDFSQARVRLKE